MVYFLKLINKELRTEAPYLVNMWKAGGGDYGWVRVRGRARVGVAITIFNF